ncbi:MAG: tetraacyldisaccharide 4'-kinase [Salinarimonadaceae bacterium]|nr:MAG: tetraacyldisaccharide 4'-kinase [Salinarimonadaceae bacterium]
MRAPGFWRGPTPSPLAQALRPAAAIYGSVAAARMVRVGALASVPVICIGNFTVGGTGKTPAALAVAALLAQSGEKPFFLTRGHGGRIAGPEAIDLSLHGHGDVGDEPLLLARAAPTIVSRDRPAGAALAARMGASVVVMDDGFQNSSLVKDLGLLLVDGETGVMNGLCLPAGPLRAPLEAQWPHVDALVVMGEGAAGDRLAAQARERRISVLRARLEPEPEAAQRLAGARLLAFAGIGRPEKFFDTLRACGAHLVEAEPFPDHHPYSSSELAALRARAAARGLTLATTEKDAVRLTDAGDIATLPVRAVFDDAQALNALLRVALTRARERRSVAK